MADPRHNLADPGHARTARDPRLDVLRGLCLVMIFINHVPGNALEVLTTRNFGFSDAAEGFVMMSGIAAGIAYGPDFRAPGRYWTGLTRCWKRAWTLYLVHIMTCLVALGLAAATAKYLGAGEILLNSMDADGTTDGFDIELIEKARSAVSVPIIASGGAGTAQHFVEAAKAGADAVLAASVFHFGTLTVAEVKQALANAGFEVRL